MAATLKVPTIFTAVDGVSKVYDKMNKKSKSFSEGLGRVGDGAGIAALAMAAPLGVALNSAIKFEDKMSDVAKTTGLSGKPLEDYGKSLLDMSGDTRTSIEELQSIGEIGGQLGIAEKDLLSFTDAANKFNVALGSDYGGGIEEAVSQVGKVKDLFADTRKLDPSTALTKVGSAFNQLGAVGSGTTDNINDFVLRIGALPDAIKPTFKATAALGTFFEEMGIDSQIASGGLSNLLLVAGKNIGGFAAQMGMTTKEAKNLLATDPGKFATEFATSLNGLAPDKLAKKLDALKIGSQETIKVVGALGVGAERLAVLQNESNDSFEKGTSLLNEYNTKNNTTAANIEKAKNNMEALSITVGTQLIPVLNKFLESLMPAIKGFTDWASESPNLAKNLVRIAVGLGMIYAIVKLVQLWIWLSSVAMGALGAATGTASIAIGSNAVALASYNIVSKVMAGYTWLATAAQWAWNVAMTANPIGLVIVAIAALIVWITLIIAKWDEWGASMTMSMGTLGWIISLIMSFKNNWDMIEESFSKGGVVAGLKAIGVAMTDAFLYPLQQVLEMLGKIPGLSNFSSEGVDKLNEIRNGLGLTQGKPALDSPAVANQKATNQSLVTSQNNLAIDIKDKGGNVNNVQSSGPLNIPIRTSSTTSNKNWNNGN